MNPLRSLRDCRQSVWLDYIRRSLITGGELRRLIEEDGCAGAEAGKVFEEVKGLFKKKE